MEIEASPVPAFPQKLGKVEKSPEMRVLGCEIDWQGIDKRNLPGTGLMAKICLTRSMLLESSEVNMKQKIASVALVVRDYDEAIAFYTQKLQFELVEDTPLGGGKRWVVVRPPGGGECSLLLAKAANMEQESRVGNQTGGRVFLFLHTDDFQRDYAEMRQRGVRFVELPRHEEFGTVVVFEDLYGNKWDLIERGAAG